MKTGIITMTASLSRRHFIGTAAAGVGLGFLPSGWAFATPVSTWRQNILGTEFCIHLLDEASHKNHQFNANSILKKLVSHIEKQAQFFDPDLSSSPLSQLNKTGFLEQPPFELFQVLTQAKRLFKLTSGVFDPSVPLGGQQSTSLHQISAEKNVSHSDFSSLRIDENQIRLSSNNSPLTLGGLLHGFLVDQTIDLLEAQGVTAYQVSLGSICAERQASKRSAQAQLSSLTGCVIHPRTFAPAERLKQFSIHVEVEKAVDADGLATAFALMDAAQIAQTLTKLGHGRVHLRSQSGAVQAISIS